MINHLISVDNLLSVQVIVLVGQSLSIKGPYIADSLDAFKAPGRWMFTFVATHMQNAHRTLPWWRHQMETVSALLAICAGNSPVPGEFPAQRPATRSFDVFFDLRLNKRLNKQSSAWWFETLSRPLWRHSNVEKSNEVTLTHLWYWFINVETEIFLEVPMRQCRDWNIHGKIYQYHGCWCPGDARLYKINVPFT